MSHSDDTTSRRDVLKVAGGLLTALGMGGVASASTDGGTATTDDRSVEPLGNRPDVRSIDAEPLGNRPDVRGGVYSDDDTVEIQGNRPDVR